MNKRGTASSKYDINLVCENSKTVYYDDQGSTLKITSTVDQACVSKYGKRTIKSK